MHSAFAASICRIGIFIICAQALVHFRPDSSYEKYLKMLVSIMILLQVFQMFGGFLKGSQAQSLPERVAWFEERLNESMEDAARSRESAERLREQMTLEEVRRRLQEAEEAQRREAEEAQRREAEEREAVPEEGIRVEEIAPVETIRIDMERGEKDVGETEGTGEEVVPQR